MMTTAAGTLRPSRVIVIGAGVAGLQAIATARRLGAEVEAYDIRSTARERIESLGASMIDTGVEATDAAGFARPLRRDEQQQQHDVLAEHLSRAHAVICAASIPGRPAPRIVTTDMVDGMLPDTVIVDMAAATGGNCELTRPGEHVQYGDTLIAGPLNLPSLGAVHASEMYARNLSNMLALILDSDGKLVLDEDDDIVSRCVLTHDGDVCHAVTAALMKRPHRAFGAARIDSADDQTEAVSDWIEENDKTSPDPLGEQVDGESTETGKSPASPSTSTGTTSSGRVETETPESAGRNAAASVVAGVAASAASVRRVTSAAERPDDPSLGATLTDTTVDSSAATSSATAAVDDADVSDEGDATDESVERDDLTVIDGIGPALQRRLYAFGVEQLSTLADLDAPGRERLAVQLELDDEIESADWVGQARALLGMPRRRDDDEPVAVDDERSDDASDDRDEGQESMSEDEK